MALGVSDPELFDDSTLALTPAKSHINRIFAKTRSRDRAAATQYGQAHNLQ